MESVTAMNRDEGDSVSKLLSIQVWNYIFQIYSGITYGRVLNGELYTQHITEANLSTFVYRVFCEIIL